MMLVPQCWECRTAVTEPDGRETLVSERLLSEELRERLAADGWEVTPGNPRVNRVPTDSLGGDRLHCPACLARHQAAAGAAQRRLDADLARPRTRTVDRSARLGAGWALTQREGDAERHRWLVEHQGTVRGMVYRYKRVNGTFSSGWEARHLLGTDFCRREAPAACAYLPNNSSLWRSRDLAAWGVATSPPHHAPRPDWATCTRKES
ncbi:hypothetical protein ACFV4E_15515 [Streptomyces hygroscopicus]|uniref:HNH endonuclease n=1 Tax=Streptomyces demainii TaxID=588122 RepID=A0ABT9L6M5_9ACTN|nr:hypothetical protein [Streptomyces demainii]MDP9616374.1 hypothetical protein [Streptomyces demainii]